MSGEVKIVAYRKTIILGEGMGADADVRLWEIPPGWSLPPDTDDATHEGLVLWDDYAALLARVEAAERDAKAMRRCAVKYLGWLRVHNAEEVLRKDMSDPEMCGGAAIDQAMGEGC